MKKQLLNLSVAIAATMFLAGSALAQWAPNAYTINYVTEAPKIDGDSTEWANVTASYLNVPYAAEVVTFAAGQSAYIKAVWNDTAVFVLISIPDDNFYPASESGLASWLSDKAEIYFDCNASIVEGAAVTDNGPDASGSGHHQYAPSFGDASGANSQHAYEAGLTTDGTTYFLEFSFGASYLTDRGAAAITLANGLVIGFDATVIDLDEATSTDPINRINWSNNTVDTRTDGVAGESWTTMDASGDMTFAGKPSAVNTVNLDSKAIYPNVTSTTFNVNVDATNVVIINSIGQVVKQINSNVSEVNVSELPAGLYIVNMATKNGNVSSKLIVR
jgi:hypothetical protein